VEKGNKILYDLAKLWGQADHGLVEFAIAIYRNEMVLQL